jgi:hypothetical protein
MVLGSAADNNSSDMDSDKVIDANKIDLKEGQADEIDLNDIGRRDDLAFLDKFVIKKDSTWKSLFDIILMIISVYNIFGNAYYSAFGQPTSTFFVLIDWTVETMFLLDMMFCFFQEYKDEETYNIVSKFRQIATHYFKKSFIFDLIAWVPVSLILDTKASFFPFYSRITRLLKLLRLPRLAQLLDVDKCKSLLNEYYGKKLQEAVLKNDNEFYFPILRVLVIVNFYNLFSIITIIFTISYFL